MPKFRLYHFADGQVVRSERFEARDEAAAVDEAVIRSNGGRSELWTGTRLVLAYCGNRPGEE